MNHGESKVALALVQLGVRPDDVEVQFRVGPFRLDFAFVRERIAIEADGWVHTARSVIDRDKARDALLRSWGWLVVRLDTQCDVDMVVLSTVLEIRKRRL